jgi:hypothetical protein
MLDDQQVVRAAPSQVAGMGALGVQGVRGHDGAGDLDAVQQRGEHRDLVGLRPHLGLAQDHAMGMVEGRQQVTAAFAAVGGAA